MRLLPRHEASTYCQVMEKYRYTRHTRRRLRYTRSDAVTVDNECGFLLACAVLLAVVAGGGGGVGAGDEPVCAREREEIVTVLQTQARSSRASGGGEELRAQRERRPSRERLSERAHKRRVHLSASSRCCHENTSMLPRMLALQRHARTSPGKSCDSRCCVKTTTWIGTRQTHRTLKNTNRTRQGIGTLIMTSHVVKQPAASTWSATKTIAT